MGATIVATNRAELYSMSFAHFYGSLLYAIPSGIPYTSLEKLFFPFNTSVWMYIGVLFVVAIAIMLIFKMLPENSRDFVFGKSNDTPFFNMMNIFLGGSVTLNKMPVRNFARTIFLIWLLFSLVVRNAYQGKLFDNLRSNQRKAPLFLLKDLYESNLRIYLYESFYQNLVDFLPATEHRFVYSTLFF